MAQIKVHVLNFHGLCSHIEILLEDISAKSPSYYIINRWAQPNTRWTSWGKYIIDEADSVYSFVIEADPLEIVAQWQKYWKATTPDASVMANNCAVSTQWFLNRFAGIPNPSLSNLSVNHLAFGILWPSFIPCPITLPGRIMSNVKFHVEASDSPKTTTFAMRLFVYTSLALATLTFAASVFALSVAATVLTSGLAGFAVAGCSLLAATSAYSFFKAYNAVSATLVSKPVAEKKEANEAKLGYDNRECTSYYAPA